VVSAEAPRKQVEKPSESRAEKPTMHQAEKQQEPSGFQPFKGERQSIVASWYGPDFNGKPTASGEIYNMNAYTCAHKEYPFGTKLKVTSARNNKETECIVNDRGPFVAGRDLDLSYACAKSIDLIVTGTQRVYIEPQGRDLHYVKYIRYGAVNGTLTIQVSSFKDESNAKRLKSGLELRYQNVYILESNVKGEKYYRVRVGKFGSKSDASMTGKTLADEGYNVLITHYEQAI
jgi:rare lipoprotein A